jgi:hypothetical protein
MLLTMTGEVRLGNSDTYDSQRAVDYYRKIFEEELVAGSIVGMEVGGSGWAAYRAAEPDTGDRYWLSPLFRVEPEPFPSAVFVRRDPDGFRIDFSDRCVSDRDHYYEGLLSAEQIDETLAAGRPYALPVVEVIGPDYKRPGFYDRNPDLERPQGYSRPPYPGRISGWAKPKTS